jgi:hypothetical protein
VGTTEEQAVTSLLGLDHSGLAIDLPLLVIATGLLVWSYRDLMSSIKEWWKR